MGVDYYHAVVYGFAVSEALLAQFDPDTDDDVASEYFQGSLECGDCLSPLHLDRGESAIFGLALNSSDKEEGSQKLDSELFGKSEQELFNMFEVQVMTRATGDPENNHWYAFLIEQARVTPWAWYSIWSWS